MTDIHENQLRRDDKLYDFARVIASGALYNINRTYAVMDKVETHYLIHSNKHMITKLQLNYRPIQTSTFREPNLLTSQDRLIIHCFLMRVSTFELTYLTLKNYNYNNNLKRCGDFNANEECDP